MYVFQMDLKNVWIPVEPLCSTVKRILCRLVWVDQRSCRHLRKQDLTSPENCFKWVRMVQLTQLYMDSPESMHEVARQRKKEKKKQLTSVQRSIEAYANLLVT